ncbi:respiratory nitrate reductase subunit gamma [Streptomyces luteolifulvus]|jgi:nitrate reductase gamma subunit|uniref:Nitrate reductase-like protein NarX n=1 Tax=Streptomyces luteolifulvus TaxID=2615112 RepID=A0A6H9V6N5_9ACTN|nr:MULTISPECIES: respiratory nitrate reductase subunit gamma [Streptomyces]KAB1149741.1 respiratory nitrate reductase subunit gamma [Streptomyces luteolifulvus]MXM68025.1 respiratory nitrate reductase subunit gamma [Streptomyces sp. HUCO-GS316]
MTTLLAADETGTGAILLWVVLPYVVLAVFVLGHVWRYRYDKFGWTTRSSQLYERRLLRIGSPLFHFGILVVLLGHIGGLLIPESWTEAAGISEDAYHVSAVVLGTIAGIATVGGLAILIYRRRTVGPVFSATTRNDKAMYVSLTVTIGLGLAATVAANIVGGGYNYRETISPWFRSIFYFQPDPDLMSESPVLFQLHAISALLLFAFWPFTRLVHMLTAPLGYLTRPYIVYRSRDTRLGARPPRRGWERTGV